MNIFKLPLNFALSIILLVSCLIVIAYHESVLLNELCKSLSVVACVFLLATISNVSKEKKNTSEK
jgi:hypothetical protein